MPEAHGNAKIVLVAALEREIGGLTRGWKRVEREHVGRKFVFLAKDGVVAVCGGMGTDAARRAAEAAIGFYRPERLRSVGFAGALDGTLRVGDIFVPGAVVDARDGSRVEIRHGTGVLVTFMAVAGAEQKRSLARAYGAGAVDMEAAGVAAAANAHGIEFDAVKVISDELDFEMAEMARFIDGRGQFKTGSFAVFALLRPWLWRRVARLASNSSKAARALAGHLENIAHSADNTVEAKTM
jgi:adenosylhomocysteine nucleosidase